MKIWTNARRVSVVTLLCLSTFKLAVDVCHAQPLTPARPASAVEPPQQSTGEQPLPGISELIAEAIVHQRSSWKTLSQYTYHSLDSEQILDSHGAVKKTTTKDFEIFCIVDVNCFHRLVAVDGKPLPDDAVKRQKEQIDTDIAWMRERNEKIGAGQPAPPQPKRKSDEFDDDDGFYAYFISTFLQAGPSLGTFSNVRRVDWHGRPTIAIDYLGNPKAKSQSLIEGVFRNLAGTVWVDDQDRTLTRFEGHVYQDYKVGGGLLADVHKGATVEMEWARVNGEVWLPATFSGRGSARILVFSSHSEQLDRHWSDYRKFRTRSTILPAVDVVPDAPAAGGLGSSQR